MSKIIVTGKSKASPQKVWQVWQKAQPWNNWDEDTNGLNQGSKGHVTSNKGKVVPYKILNVQEGESFTICWKALFIKLIFTYQVKPIDTGSEITYLVHIKGFFSWPIRSLLKRKIQKNLEDGLTSLIKQLN
ncbi:MAG: hypothetical protein COT84_06890 [Chlamydiae bacterium CG10_big_fil_rev_8_21_14_0_10_35_9]|nr:MAG: hypothetical protein COT84_06890 [Chlamydiae bacterium CG10_big_fil_rev_8_21_14_0_10_35_9]